MNIESKIAILSMRINKIIGRKTYVDSPGVLQKLQRQRAKLQSQLNS